MSHDELGEMHLLIQADVDGELDPAKAARVAAHLDDCPQCQALQARLLASRQRFAASPELRRSAPDSLRDAVRAKLPSAKKPTRPRLADWQGGALAACLALIVCLPLYAWLTRGDDLADWVVASHIRALQPTHLVDVVSTDQHTVKPWFDGRLPFAPPVKDLSADGFALLGGRLDYLPGHTAATLIYRRDKHIINLFVWPRATAIDARPKSGAREGYNFVQWRADGMQFWAVSDLESRELDDFAALWR